MQTSDLGLPELPGIGGGSSDTSLTSLISGTHTLQVWASGPDKQRLAIHGTLGETDLIRNGTDLWNWSSQDNTATHTKLSSADDRSSAEQASDTAVRHPSTPQEAAAKALAAIEPTTAVTTDPAVEVAGRPAYDLVLSPKDSGSLIGQVRIAIDGEKKVPLRVQVIAYGRNARCSTPSSPRSTSRRPTAPTSPSTPRPGTKVTEKQGAEHRREQGARRQGEGQGGEEAAAAQNKLEKDTKVVGNGWSSVIVTKADLSADIERRQQLDRAGQGAATTPRCSGS